MSNYRTPPITLHGEAPMRLIVRWPTMDEKMAHIDAETDARGGLGNKPGEMPAVKLSALYRASIAAVTPLIVGIEQDGITIEDFDRARLEDARLADVLFGLAQFMFRPASVSGDFGAVEDAGTV